MDNNFDKIYEKYGEMLYRIAFVYLGNASDTEDVLQEVFITYLYNPPEFKNEEHKKAWLIRAVQCRCINLLKKTSRKSVCLEDLQLTAPDNDKDKKLDVIKAVIALAPKYKSPLLLYYYNDYSVEEIAKILKITKSAVKMRLKRGREILKIQLEDYNYEEK